MKIAEKFTGTLLVLVFVTSVYTLHSQDRDQNRDMQQNKERIEAQKVAFITTKLDLSSAEAEKFWPVYNEFKNEQKEMQRNWREKHNLKPEDIAELTDAEAEKFAKDQLDHEQEMLDKRKELIIKMKGVLSPQKILMLLEAEKEFRVELMRKVSQGRAPDKGRYENRR